ncbi:MAG: D-alanyl-D-alanine carboxypeptidase, partial [Gemmatimonadaceae bacterium]
MWGRLPAAVGRTSRAVLLRAAVLLLTLGGLTVAPTRVVDAQGARATTRRPAAKKPAARKPAARKPAARKRAAARPAPVLRATTPRSASALAADLGATIGASTRSGQWGAMVVSLTRGDTLYSLNAGLSMQPASTMKLMTTALVLDRFGADHRFRTTVLRDGPLTPDGTLHGNLILRGTGDPAFSGRYLQGGPSAAVDILASLVGGAGVRRVTGQVIGDASAFESRLVPAGWKESYLHLAYAAPV